jgi:hypothetical protein
MVFHWWVPCPQLFSRKNNPKNRSELLLSITLYDYFSKSQQPFIATWDIYIDSLFQWGFWHNACRNLFLQIPRLVFLIRDTFHVSYKLPIKE